MILVYYHRLPNNIVAMKKEIISSFLISASWLIFLHFYEKRN